MTASLRDRLAAIRKERGRGNEEPPVRAGREAPAPGNARPVPGFEPVAADVFRRESVLALSREELDEFAAATSVLVPGTPPEAVLFYDTETTGLSGGAGTVAFLFGAARLEGGSLRAVQLFLADYPGEPDYLGLVAEVMGGSGLIVSYNGRTFDGPLLRTRFVLNRMTFEPPPQLDLLFHSRRIWRGSYENCGLGTLEREVLGKSREIDIPGSLAPLAYFDYLRTGGTEDLCRVFEHNLEDVHSLSALYCRVGSLLIDPRPDCAADPAGLGILAAEKNPKAGLPFLMGLAESGNQRALRWIVTHLKRKGEWDEAARLLSPFAEKNPWAGVELAKYYEHRRRSPAEALTLVEKLLLSPFTESFRDDLGKRRSRLIKKIV